MIEHSWVYEHTDEVGHYADSILVCTCGWSCSKSTALAEGYTTVGKYWSMNHESYYSEIGADNDHSYTYVNLPEDWIVDTPATDVWTCSSCGTSTTNHDEVTGHSMISAKGYATCFKAAEEAFVCTVCDYSYTTTIQESLGHTWSDWTIVEQPSESSRGWATRTCTFEYHNGAVCGYTMGDYADLVVEGQHYHTYKPESLTVCIECGEDSVPD